VRIRTQLEAKIRAWVSAGVIDAPTSERILAFEAGQERKASLRWPVLLAMAFGGVLVAAGITLFVAAHWAELSPLMRFSLVLLMVAVFHAGGALLADRFPAFSTTLHGVGTACLGAAIYLTAQIFNLHENWATGVLLWSIGAAAGVILLRDWVQVAFLSLLFPGWLLAQWLIATGDDPRAGRPITFGIVLLALTYLSSGIGEQQSYARRTLAWVGGLALLPCVAIAMTSSMEWESSALYYHGAWASRSLYAFGWIVAVGGPLLLALLLRGQAARLNVLWAVWIYALQHMAHLSHHYDRAGNKNLLATLGLYLLCMIGATAMVAWGFHEKRKERVNLGVAGFAISVLFFYFDSFMGKLGRSLSLVALGVLCLAGGYALEMTRRRLVARMETKS